MQFGCLLALKSANQNESFRGLLGPFISNPSILVFWGISHPLAQIFKEVLHRNIETQGCQYIAKDPISVNSLDPEPPVRL